LWDTSALVPNGSIAGKMLQGLLGYDARPAGMQIAFFVTSLLVIYCGMAWAKRASRIAASEPRSRP
jgi:high-affinity iron transporter